MAGAGVLLLAAGRVPVQRALRSKPVEAVKTYGDISGRVAQHAMNDILRRAAFENPGPIIKPSRWQRLKRLFRPSLWRWRIAEKLRDLAYWIEP
jgi:hypothetical protein